mgnify:CR=1 FL=1
MPEDLPSEAPPAEIDAVAAAAAARDLALMERTKAGDMDAFRELIEAHEDRVIGALAKMLNDPVEAEDLAQQVFVRIWKNASRWEPTAKFTTWLYTITRNLALNEIRPRERHQAYSPNAPREGDSDEHVREHADSTVKSPDTSALDAELMAAVDRAISELPEEQRTAIILRRYDDTPYEDIAQILGSTVPAVKSLIWRARQDLREKLRRYLEP